MAKELVSTLAAVDTMILVDQTPGIINSVALERIARKALGLVRAFKDVTQERDWKRPAGTSGNKGWKSKVNWEAAKRCDPGMVEDGEFVHREAEEEARGEIEKDASMLKAYAKIAEWRGSSSSGVPKDD